MSIQLMKASELVVGMFVLIDGVPCEIVDYASSKLKSKNGIKKAYIVGKEIFTNRKKETMVPLFSEVEIPIIIKKEYELLDISDDNYLSLMNDKGKGEVICDIKLNINTEVGGNLKQEFDKNNNNQIIVRTATVLKKEDVLDFRVVQ
ncbi:hypothetical protein ABK040_008934 [Willaertia magna]